MDDLVYLVRTRFDGTSSCVVMCAWLAMIELGYSDDNGVKWASARIIADDTDMGAWDRSA